MSIDHAIPHYTYTVHTCSNEIELNSLQSATVVTVSCQTKMLNTNKCVHTERIENVYNTYQL